MIPSNKQTEERYCNLWRRVRFSALRIFNFIFILTPQNFTKLYFQCFFFLSVKIIEILYTYRGSFKGNYRKIYFSQFQYKWSIIPISPANILKSSAPLGFLGKTPTMNDVSCWPFPCLYPTTKVCWGKKITVSVDWYQEKFMVSNLT